jgi:hypothetical protein
VAAAVGAATGMVVTFASAEDSRALPEEGPGSPVEPSGEPEPEPDADGLDASWDDLEGLDFTGLDVADLEAVLAEEESRAPEVAAKAPKLGTGARFKALRAKGMSPALAAWIGRKKFGKKRFAQLAAKARKRKAHAASGTVEVDAAGRHGPWTGTHSHPHTALGTQGGDLQHEHSHTHKGDGRHAHVHAAQGTTKGGAVDFTTEQEAALRSALGLGEADDLTPDAVVTAAGALAERAEAKVAASAGVPLTDRQMVIDKDAWAERERRLAALETREHQREVAERDQVIAAAVRQGKFGPASTEDYARAWDKDPENTRKIIAMMRPNVMPVSDMGVPGGDGSADAEHFPDYHALFGGQEGVSNRG